MSIDDFIPLMIPNIEQQDIDAVVQVLNSGMLIQGAKVEEFEFNIAKYLGVNHAIAVSNGTATLHMALVALGLGKGDEIIVPAFSYMATANVIELIGATPVFVDIDIDTFNIDTDLIEQVITPRTKAIIPVHEFGLACDISKICSIANKHNLLVIEDAACALGAKENEQFVGTFGNVGSFSFHPRKAITSGEGGMLVTNDDILAKKLRTLRNHGIEMISGKMEFIEAGFNYRLTDFQAALVNSQFQRFEKTLTLKNHIANQYFQHLSHLTDIQLPKIVHNKTHTWQSFHILVKKDRDNLIKYLKENGIGTNLGAQCMPEQMFFKQKYRIDCRLFYPNALKSYRQGLVLPLYEKMTEENILKVISVLHNALNS